MCFKIEKMLLVELLTCNGIQGVLYIHGTGSVDADYSTHEVNCLRHLGKP